MRLHRDMMDAVKVLSRLVAAGRIVKMIPVAVGVILKENDAALWRYDNLFLYIGFMSIIDYRRKCMRKICIKITAKSFLEVIGRVGDDSHQ